MTDAAYTKTYHAFHSKLGLDGLAVNFLSTIYSLTVAAKGAFTKTQRHLENITYCTEKQQRRIRKKLISMKLMSENVVTEHDDDNGCKTRIYYKANVKRLDALLDEVKANQAKQKKQESKPEEPKAKEQQLAMPPVKMYAEWKPDADSLEAFLNSYDIEEAFVTHIARNEFVGYWINEDRELTELQWHSKFYADVCEKWGFALNRQKRTAKINAAKDKKADAIVVKESKLAAKILAAANQIRTPKTTAEQLLDTSWADEDDVSCNEQDDFAEFMALGA